MLRNAIASSSRSYAAAHESRATTCLVLGGVPRSALPSDVLLALEKAGALSTTNGKTITISNILKQPPASSTNTPLDSSFHITFRTIEQSRIARRQIETRGLFFNLRRVQQPDGRDQRSPGKRVMTVEYEKNPGQSWYQDKMRRGLTDRSGDGMVDGTDQPGFPDVTRMAPLDQSLRGKQVWLQGLPYKLTDQAVRTQLRDFMISDLGGVIPLPSAKGQHKSFIVTLPSISEAHRLIRKLHMQTWGGQYDEDGKRNALIRAQVIW